MFSLIITIISIALVAVLALATLYYGGAAYNQGAAKAQAAKLQNQAQQLQGAAVLYRTEMGFWPLSIADMVSAKYLSSEPVAQADGVSAALAEVAQWTMVSASYPVFSVGPIDVETCKSLNQEAYGVAGVLKYARADYLLQCYGTDPNNLRTLSAKDTVELQAAALAPDGAAVVGLVVLAPAPNACSTDTSIAGWLPGTVSPTQPCTTTVSFDSDSLSFPDTHRTASSGAQDVTLTNTSNGDLEIASVTIDASFSQTNNCPTLLATGASCTYSVVFTPASMGAIAGNLTVTSAAGAREVALSGLGLQAVATTSVPSLTLANTAVGAHSATQTVTLNNGGNLPLSLSGATVTGPFSATTTCTATLAVGASCDYTVTFNPVAMGTVSGSLSIASSAGTNSVTLGGTGLMGDPVLSDTSWGFGSVVLGASSSTRAVTLTNIGTAPLTGITETIAAPFTATTSDCGTSLAANASCTYTLGYTPTVAGAVSGTFSVVTSAGTETVALTGTGQGAPVLAYRNSSDATLTSLSFPDTAVGSNATAMVATLKNTGASNLVFTSPGVTVSAPFSLSANNCAGATVAPNATCTVSVVFSPTAGGVANATLAVSTNDTAATTLALSGTGTTNSVVAMAAGGSTGNTYQLVLKSDGSVWARGANSYGQLGQGTVTSSSTFVQVTGFTGQATAIAARGGRSFIIAGGNLWGAGYNLNGQLGNNSTSNSSVFVQAQGITGTVTAVAAGGLHTAVIAGGQVWSAGYNGYGAFGTGVDIGGTSSTFVQSPGIPGTATAIAATEASTSVVADGQVWSAGQNSYTGQLGIGSDSSDSSVFVQSLGLPAAPTALVGGYRSVHAIVNGQVWSTGMTSVASSSFVQSTGIVGTAVAVAAGGSHVVALTTDGALWSMGSNSSGELGDASTTSRTKFVRSYAWTGSALESNITASQIAASDSTSHIIRNGTLLHTANTYIPPYGGAYYVYKVTASLP